MATKDISDGMVCKAYYLMQLQRDEGCIEYEYPYIILMRLTGQPEKVCYRAMERAAERCYIDYGVSLRTGWLTKKGLDLLTDSEGRHK